MHRSRPPRCRPVGGRPPNRGQPVARPSKKDMPLRELRALTREAADKLTEYGEVRLADAVRQFVDRTTKKDVPSRPNLPIYLRSSTWKKALETSAATGRTVEDDVDRG